MLLSVRQHSLGRHISVHSWLGCSSTAASLEGSDLGAEALDLLEEPALLDGGQLLLLRNDDLLQLLNGGLTFTRDVADIVNEAAGIGDLLVLDSFLRLLHDAAHNPIQRGAQFGHLVLLLPLLLAGENVAERLVKLSAQLVFDRRRDSFDQRGCHGLRDALKHCVEGVRAGDVARVGVGAPALRRSERSQSLRLGLQRLLDEVVVILRDNRLRQREHRRGVRQSRFDVGAERVDLRVGGARHAGEANRRGCRDRRRRNRHRLRGSRERRGVDGIPRSVLKEADLQHVASVDMEPGVFRGTRDDAAAHARHGAVDVVERGRRCTDLGLHVEDHRLARLCIARRQERGSAARRAMKREATTRSKRDALQGARLASNVPNVQRRIANGHQELVRKHRKSGDVVSVARLPSRRVRVPQ
mmetsp:Transcript_3651/g.11479  ORF Transcript_3651/g.11479 Transcript_3651/m.11479 type:complete len:414 (-) Transcript_3651:675-1916(-)